MHRRQDEDRRIALSQVPKEGSIVQARVCRIEGFGAFVELDGRHSALVHISQLRAQRVEAVRDVVSVGDDVWVMILPESKPGKLSASMKAVDQATGTALIESGGGAGSSNAADRRRNRTEPEEDVSQMTWGLQPLDRSGEGDAGSSGPSEDPAKPKQGANYATTGKLAEETNKVNGVVLKWAEPPDAAKPTRKWRLYVFKGKESLEPYHIHRQSGYLLGRERRVCDIPLDHPSCSSQHAVIQYRMTEKQQRVPGGGDKLTRLVRPYVMDLGSTNGTYVNGSRIEAERYMELLEKDVVRFGYSSREYVLLHAESATD